jgi:hypothetical protein
MGPKGGQLICKNADYLSQALIKTENHWMSLAA